MSARSRNRYETGFCALWLVALAAASPGAGADEAGAAREILKAAGVQGGLLVHLGCGEGRLTAELGAGKGWLVHGLEADGANVSAARERLRTLGRYGTVSVERFAGTRLPYAENLVNLLIVEDRCGVSTPEILRVLAPGGVAYEKAGDGWKKTVKPRPGEIDDWTHYLYDATGNAVAKDTAVAPPNRMQWVASPRYARSHEVDTTVCALVSAGGRVFYILDEGLCGITDERLPEKWSLVARDAFSSVELWRRPVPDWGWPQWKKDLLAGKDWTGLRGQRTRTPIALPRRLVAVGPSATSGPNGRVYVTLGFTAPVTALDAATGEVVRTYAGTAGTMEILADDGMLVLAVRRPSAPRPAGEPAARKKARGRSAKPAEMASVVSLDPAAGRVLWQTKPHSLVPLALAVCGGRVFYHTGKELVAVDRTSGRDCWRTPCGAGGSLFGTNQTLVCHPGVVLIADTRSLRAYSAETGKLLWQGKGARSGCANPPDLFVADGLVWPAGSFTGFDPMTGEPKRTIDKPSCLITPGHHLRCYRGKATERFILNTKRGVEFIDLRSAEHMKHDWIRGTCRLGFVPANGLLYVPPNQCFCYPGVNINGFKALCASDNRPGGTPAPPFERGPAYGQIPSLKSEVRNREDWPAFRHDSRRTGRAATAVPAKVRPIWEAKIGAKLTQPVVCENRLYVAAVHEHRVGCFDAATGKPRWSFTAGGRVDSPPTLHEGRVLFGARDGWVYCLRAVDGEMAWRYRAAPEPRRIVAFGQVESAWPVHGSVCMLRGVAYVAAGRSSYLDGGIRVCGLDPATGKVLHDTKIEGPYPDVTKDVGRPFDMEGTLSDVLVTDGEHLFLRQVVLDAALRRVEAPRITKMGDRKFPRHVFATQGLLDDSAWNRTFWMYTGRWPGFYIANQAPKTGQLLVVGEKATYAVKYFTRRNRHSPMFFPGTDGYLLFADDNGNEPMLLGSGRARPVAWLPKVNKAIGWGLDTPAVNKDKGTGFTRSQPAKWQTWTPVRIRAMVLAGETLFVAGPPDVLDPEDPYAAFEGRKGGVLWAVSADDGKKLAEYKLDSPPAFDGLIAAGGRLYLTTRDGRVMCMGNTKEKG